MSSVEPGRSAGVPARSVRSFANVGRPPVAAVSGRDRAPGSRATRWSPAHRHTACDSRPARARRQRPLPGGGPRAGRRDTATRAVVAATIATTGRPHGRTGRRSRVASASRIEVAPATGTATAARPTIEASRVGQFRSSAGSTRASRSRGSPDDLKEVAKQVARLMSQTSRPSSTIGMWRNPTAILLSAIAVVSSAQHDGSGS